MNDYENFINFNKKTNYVQSISVCDTYKRCKKKLIVYHVEKILKILI